MPRLLKKHLTPLQYPELRLIAMLGMEMDVSLAYSGDTDNVFKWICDHQDKFRTVDILDLAKPKKPGKPGPLRNETIAYIKKIQEYMAGKSDLPEWANICCNSDPEVTVTLESTDEDQKPMESNTTVKFEGFPETWMTKAGTPDKRKAVVRAVLGGKITLEEALEKEKESVKYIPKTSNAKVSEPTEDLSEPEVASETGVSEVVAQADASGDRASKRVVFKKNSSKSGLLTFPILTPL